MDIVDGPRRVKREEGEEEPVSNERGLTRDGTTEPYLARTTSPARMGTAKTSRNGNNPMISV